MLTDEIVGVHDGVNVAVQNNGEVNIAVKSDAKVKPVDEENGRVVVHV